MRVIFWSIVSIFIVSGIQYVIRALITAKLNNAPSVILCGYNNEDETECTLRCILFENPDSEIYIVKKDRELSPVLEKMLMDYPNIHIKYAGNAQ